MLIAQITDVHIGFDRRDPAEQNLRRLKVVVRHMLDAPTQPDMLLLTGDLTEYGDAKSYERLAEAVSPCPFPVWPIVGNHDDRAALLAAFPQTPSEAGFVHYALDCEGVRMLLLDTLEPGRHGGEFCEARAAWLDAQLSAHPATPAVIVMHHPPFESGLAWLDSAAHEAWIGRFAGAIAGHSQVEAILSGHLHRSIATAWKGAALTVCPSTAPSVALDLNPVDPERPDGRAMISEEPPGYALHRWDGGRLISHFAYAGDWPALARFDETMQGVVRLIEEERRQG